MFGQRNDTMLGDGIGRVGYAAHQACNGGGVNNVSRLVLLEHDGHEQPLSVDHAHQINADHPRPVLLSARPGATRTTNPGVVEQ